MRDSQKDLFRKILGKSGEASALRYLKGKGYSLVEKNYRTPFGEADLIVRKEELVFVEVKTRSSDSYGVPSEAVGYKKRETYRKIASYWFLSHEEEPFRFDVVEILGKKLNHIQNAF